MKSKRAKIAVSTENIFPIIKKWLYSEREIFLRELVSNASDAIVKHRRLVSLGKAEEADAPYRIDITVNKAAGTLTVSDNGIGMTGEEVEKYICQMALSGALDFIEKYESEGGSGIIGHFGLGFYSAFMVADRVELLTRSYLDAPAVCFSASEDGEYELTAATRDSRGTDVILYLNEESREYLEASRLFEILNRYCAFMPAPIYLADAEKEEEEGEPVNDTDPLWQRAAADVGEEDYHTFYSRVFGDHRKPLFSMHLSADYPLNFKGVLFFPKLSRDFESLEGQIKLYYNQVFVADNIREVIPEYLLMLRGVIDCPELPLNVSRSYLQDSAYVRKVSAYIVKKVADKLTSMCKSDRAAYEAMWADLSTFVAYGCISDRKFYDRASSAVLLTLAGGEKRTVDEILEQAASEEHEGILYYTTDADRQAGLVATLSERGISVIVCRDRIDTRFLEVLEGYLNIKCRRIDASTDALRTAGEEGADGERLTALFEGVSAEGLTLSYAAEHLGEGAAPALLTVSEEDVRMQEMMRYYAPDAPAAPLPARLTLNLDSSTVTRLLSGDLGGEEGAVARYLLSLSLLAYRPLSGEEMSAFLTESYRLLGRLS